VEAVQDEGRKGEGCDEMKKRREMEKEKGR
jgi:hypothetical protein